MRNRLSLKFRTWAWAVAAFAAAHGAQAEFGPVAFTDGDDPTSGTPRMSQSTAGQLLWIGGGLSLVYWSQTANEETAPETPSRIWSRAWDVADGWGEPVRVDRSRLDDGRDAGGSHPMQVVAGDSVVVAWHDNRHGSAAGQWNDHIELYVNRRPRDGGFGDEDKRLTQTQGTGSGDNRYLPRMAALPDGGIAVVWYDFHWDPDIAEICVAIGRADGSFDLLDVDAARVTTLADRAAGDAGRPFTMPQVVADAEGRLHITWTTGTNDMGSSLYYGLYDPDEAEWIEGPRRLATGVRGHFDPPRLAASPDGGAICLVYVDRNVDGQGNLVALRRAVGDVDWSAPVTLADGPAPQQYPAPGIDGEGRLHVAYVDRTTGARAVRYLIYVPGEGVASDVPVSDGNGDYIRPALAVSAQGRAAVVWEERLGLAASRLWFWSNAPGRNGVKDWMNYH